MSVKNDFSVEQFDGNTLFEEWFVEESAWWYALGAAFQSNLARADRLFADVRLGEEDGDYVTLNIRGTAKLFERGVLEFQPDDLGTVEDESRVDGELVNSEDNILFDGRASSDIGVGGDGDLRSELTEPIIATGGNGADVIAGGALDDIIAGNKGADAIDGGGGDDFVKGGAGRDVIDGGSGNDLLYGDYSDSRVHEDAARDGWNDTLRGGTGDDILFGNQGDDTLVGDEGNDTLIGGSGSDRFVFGEGADLVLDYEDGVDRLVFERGGFATITFNSLAEIQKYADADDDNRKLLPGVDYQEGDQIIALSFDAARKEISYSFGAEVNSISLGLEISGDDASEIITGGATDDTLEGGAGEDTLEGGDGDDTLNGGTDADTIIGGVGDDTMTGGEGPDTFILEVGDGNDTITDFEFGVDTLTLNPSFSTFEDFGALIQRGDLSARADTGSSPSLTIFYDAEFTDVAIIRQSVRLQLTIEDLLRAIDASSDILSTPDLDGVDLEGDQIKLLATDAEENDFLGASSDGAVGIAADGTVVAGASLDDVAGVVDQGSVYVFRPNSDGGYNTPIKLIAPDGAADDQFGVAVAVADNGSVAVGARNDDDRGAASGSAYVYRPDGLGLYQAPIKLTAPDGAIGDTFGISVAVASEGVAADTVVVGAIGDDDNGSSSGAAYVFKPTGPDSYGAPVKLIDPDGFTGQFLGWSVGIAGDGTVVVGAEGNNVGAAFVFSPEGEGYGAPIKLTIPEASGGGRSQFGSSVDIADNGVVIVGDHWDSTLGTNAGAAYIFRPDGAGGYLDPIKVLAPDGEQGDTFGFSVAIADDGKVAIGAHFDSETEFATGAVYLFEPDGADGYAFVAKRTDDNAAASDLLGYAVDINDAGDVAAGARGDDETAQQQGSVVVFDADVLGENTPPVAMDDVATTEQDNAVVIAVLANDNDADGDALTLTASDGANGATSVNADGTITYTPTSDFAGADSFTYTIVDGNGGSDTATVNVTITPVDNAPESAPTSQLKFNRMTLIETEFEATSFSFLGGAFDLVETTLGQFVFAQEDKSPVDESISRVLISTYSALGEALLEEQLLFENPQLIEFDREYPIFDGDEITFPIRRITTQNVAILDLAAATDGSVVLASVVDRNVMLPETGPTGLTGATGAVRGLTLTNLGVIDETFSQIAGSGANQVSALVPANLELGSKSDGSIVALSAAVFNNNTTQTILYDVDSTNGLTNRSDEPLDLRRTSELLDSRTTEITELNEDHFLLSRKDSSELLVTAFNNTLIQEGETISIPLGVKVISRSSDEFIAITQQESTESSGLFEYGFQIYSDDLTPISELRPLGPDGGALAGPNLISAASLTDDRFVFSWVEPDETNFVAKYQVYNSEGVPEADPAVASVLADLRSTRIKAEALDDGGFSFMIAERGGDATQVEVSLFRHSEPVLESDIATGSSGTIQLQDDNAFDVVSLSSITPGETVAFSSDGREVLNQPIGEISFEFIDVVSDESGYQAEFEWSYTADAADIAFLDEGDRLTQEFDVVFQDLSGNTTSSGIVVSIIGEDTI